MGRSRSWYFKTSAIADQDEELSNVLVRLMLVVNDVSLVADANDDWAATVAQKRAFRKSTARMYFIRVLLSHVYEGLKIIGEISGSPALRDSVCACDARTIADFVELESFIRSPDMKIFDRLRNRTTFHYDRQLPKKSLDEIARDEPGRLWTYSMGLEPLDWRFELADAIVDRIVVRRRSA